MIRPKKNILPSVDVRSVSKHFEKIIAVNHLSFSAYKGEIVALLGPNGAGKSTLMNMIAGYTTPTEGKIFINGYNVEESDLITKKAIGFLPEGAPLYSDMSVGLFLKYFIELKLNLMVKDDLSSHQIQQIYDKEFHRIIETAKIENVIHQKIDTLSKGYVRRVGFATSLIGNPPILLLDEPTDGLDPNQKEHMCHLIKEMSKDKTIIISTHLLDEAETISSKIVLINRGEIVVTGSVQDILKITRKKSLGEAFKFLTNNGEINEQY